MELTIDQALQKAVAAHQQGDLQSAETLYKAILEVNPSNPDANHNLGVLILDADKPDKALPFFKAALKVNAQHEQYWISYIHALIGAKLLVEAKKTLKEARHLIVSEEKAIEIENKLLEVELNKKNTKKEKHKNKQSLKPWKNQATQNVLGSPSDQEINTLIRYCNSGTFELAKISAESLIKKYPKHAFVWKILGTILHQIGQSEDGLKALQHSLLLAPNDPGAHSNLGVILKALERYDEAKLSYQKSIELKPNNIDAYYNLGNVLNELKLYSEAEANYRQAITLNPNFAEAYSNLGIVLEKLGNHSEAEVTCRRAIALKPDYVEAYSNLGNVLKELGRYSEAEENHQHAINLNPNLAEVHYNLGVLLLVSARYSEAAVSYRKAIALKQDYAEAHSNLGKVLNALGRYHEAEDSHRQAVFLKPDNITIISHSALFLPDIYSSVSDIHHWRQRYGAGIKAVGDLECKSEVEIPGATFQLAYHNLCNLKLMKERSTLASQTVAGIVYTSPHVLNWKKPLDRKIRIAYCSEFLVGHTIGKLYQGFIKKLDRSVFELIIIHSFGSKLDAFSEKLDQDADKVIFLSSILSIAHETISTEAIDILFYPDIGMSNQTYYLAHARLAPIQIVSWGHPETTGINSIDYFLSSSMIESEDADQLYSERLIKLSRLPCYYELMLDPTQSQDATSLGLPAKGTLYGCPQSLFKIHPDFDLILADILLRDPTSHLIFLEGGSSVWSELLKNRWAANYPILNERAIFLPRLPLEKFMALMGKIDVLLDPIYFGSGNTFYESMFYGVPTVTWPGQFMRGRIVAGAYQQMGIEEAPVAEQISDYADIAIQLGGDSEKRGRLKESLRNASKESLYADISIVRELEQFFLAAIEAADKGETLEINWSSQ